MFVERSEILWKEIESLSAVDGLTVYDIEKPNAGKLRIFIQRPTATQESSVPEESDSVAQGGVSSEDCARLLRRLRTFFLAEGTSLGVAPDPLLEVSSPGINRKLRTPEQFQHAIGERIKLQVEGESEALLGELQGASEHEITVSVEESLAKRSVAFASIKKANVEYKF